jgi:hypothetical protein
MTVIGGSKVSVGISSNVYDTVVKTTDDRGISEDVIYGVANHIIRNVNNYEFRELSTALQTTPITLEHCLIALKIIQADSTIMIVEKEVNYHTASGLYKFYWERELNLQNSELLAYMDEEKLAALRRTQQVSVKILTITKTAFEALMRYTQTLESRSRRASYTYTSHPRWEIDKQPLLGNNQGCCCTLL